MQIGTSSWVSCLVFCTQNRSYEFKAMKNLNIPKMLQNGFKKWPGLDAKLAPNQRQIRAKLAPNERKNSLKSATNQRQISIKSATNQRQISVKSATN